MLLKDKNTVIYGGEAPRAAPAGMKNQASIWAGRSDTDTFLQYRAILSGPLLTLRPYPYTKAMYIGDKC